MRPLKVGVVGAGFWAKYQILAWKQIPEAQVTAITNRSINKAHRLADELQIPAVEESVEGLVARSDVDVVDIITSEATHDAFTVAAARAGKLDFYGGIKAKQNIVCAVFRGDESIYSTGEEIARAIFAPVMRSHRITVEQMAILEPAMAETVTLTLMYTIREAMDEATKAGVPDAAARDFILGHINVNIGILFGYLGIEVSEGAKKAVDRGRKAILRDDWRKVFEPDRVMEEVRAIVEDQ